MKIAIVGAGIVGSTAAYYLSKEKDVEVTVFDHGLGQATKAAAGIISPWFSKRRNKAWYRMARLGADFYQELTSILKMMVMTRVFMISLVWPFSRKTIVNWTVCISMLRLG